MSDAKNYVIGIIEIDPSAGCQQSWVTLAGDDDTLDAVLARIAGHNLAGPSLAEAVSASEAKDAGHRPTTRYPSAPRKSPSASAPSPNQVTADLDELTSDLVERLAEFRGRLAAAGTL